MNIIRKLTLRHLKENKGRTIITTLGICVSVAMITAVFVSIASFMKFYGDASIFSSGNKHVDYCFLSSEQIAALQTDDRIEEVGLYKNLSGEQEAFRLFGQERCVGQLYAGDETNLKQLLTSKMDGEMPKNEHEIAVEKSFIEKNHLNWKIGDTVSLDIGQRWIMADVYIEETNEFEKMREPVNYGSWQTGEQFDAAEENISFKITGILNGNMPTRAAKIIRGLSNEEKTASVNASVVLKDVNYKSLDVIEDISKKIGVKYGDENQMTINKDYLESKFAFDKTGFMVGSLIPMCIIILVIIMIASVVLIYNSFGMSLSERTRYLGMLGSVGATKRQKRQSVYFEGLALGAVGIPLGTIGGIIGIGVTLEVLGDKIISTGMLTGIEQSGIEFKAVVPLWVIAGIVLFSIITIFISAVIPARKASAITPVEALRQNTEFKIKPKSVKSPKYIRKIFGYEGELAHKNLKRNGRKSRVITASIAISVILFISVNYFCSVFTRVNGDMDVPYQIQINTTNDKVDDIKKAVKEMEHVTDVYGLDSYQVYIGKNYPADYDNALNSEEVLTNTYKNLFNGNKQILILALDDELFNELCTENGIDYHSYYQIQDNCVNTLLLNNLSRTKSGASVFNDKAIGKKLFYNTNSETETEYYYRINHLIDFKPDNKLFNLVPKGYFAAYIPQSAMYELSELVFGKEKGLDYRSLCVETENHKETTEKIEQYLNDNRQENSTVYDMAESMESINTIMFVLQVFVYGFITLITMITIANIINTISTSIALRRKEFAMLKSVGATQKGFYKMVCLESLFYGLNALIASIPISMLVCFGLNKVLDQRDVPFEIDFVLYGCVILAVFLIVGFSMLYSISKIKKDSIIETLKQDIT